ncbi:hypothetical protein KIH21_08830 [Lacticaseibacillus paracasei subsp. paracasei]|nr:hypothetical protein KIH21_08830 [Lacticaseibacillus paracasei subsp. paracasei]
MPTWLFEFKLPELGEGLAEGEIVKWDVKPGDDIKEDDTLLEVQSDKSVEEIPSPVSGKILKILVPEGETASVGDLLVEIDDGSGPAAARLHLRLQQQPLRHPLQQRLLCNLHLRNRFISLSYPN